MATIRHTGRVSHGYVHPIPFIALHVECIILTRVSSDPEIADLQVQAKEMAGLWRKLKLDNGALGLSESELPDMNNLMKAVRDGEVEWNKKKEKGFGKVKEKFKSFLETMHAHGYLFSIIPDGSMYTSLLVGVLTSVVKVCAFILEIAGTGT